MMYKFKCGVFFWPIFGVLIVALGAFSLVDKLFKLVFYVKDRIFRKKIGEE